MKGFYTSLLILLVSTFNAQTLTQSFNEPVIGDIDKKYNIDTSGYTTGLPNSTNGSGCTWDFKKLKGAFPVVVDSFVTPVGTPAAGSYSTATYAQKRGTLFTYFRSSTSPQQTELLGAYSPSLTVTFTNAAVIASYPVNFGYSNVDVVGGSFKYNTTTGVCNGNITITADALGTVMLANNVTIHNVLRLKSVETLTLTIGIIPFGTFNQTMYNYYKPGSKFPILNMNYTTYQLLAGTPTITAEMYGTSTYFTVGAPIGINEALQNEPEFNVFPNPFSDHLNINQEMMSEENEYRFLDANGKLILTVKSLSEVNTESFSPGIYFLEIKNKQGTFHHKIVKE